MYSNHYADVIDIIINRGNSIFDTVGKELAKTNPKLFKRLVLSLHLDDKESYYAELLWNQGKIKTIKQYRQDNNIGLKESKNIIDQLATVIEFDQEEWENSRNQSVQIHMLVGD